MSIVKLYLLNPLKHSNFSKHLDFFYILPGKFGHFILIKYGLLWDLNFIQSTSKLLEVLEAA